MPTSSALLDDRLLVAHLTGARLRNFDSSTPLFTTGYWYYRACRAAILGARGQLSGPFALLDPERQSAAIGAMLRLPEEIGLPVPRALIPAMVDVSSRHRRLNVMNLEAIAAAQVLQAQVRLSPPAAAGALAPALDAEGIPWSIHEPG